MTDILHIYPDRESKVLEFKESLPKFSALMKTCVAFANTAGGQIIIGVEDGTRKIVGVSDQDRERLYEEFPNSLYDSTNSGLFAHIYERNFNERSVLVIEIPLSSRRPCFIKQEGIPNGVYLRVGASTRRAQDVHVEELIRESKHEYYDVEPTKVKIVELSQERLKFCYGKYTSKKLESDGVITSLSHEHKKYWATVAGVLMFTDNPEIYIPEAILICTQFSGTSGRDIVQTREITGPIPDLIQDGIALLEHWMQRDFELDGVKLKGKMLVPVTALREAITNGLMHRKYSIPGAMKMALYDDRLEIFSPGALPGLVDIDNLGDGTTYLRNPHIAKIARRMKLVEKLGTGIRLIFDECQKHGLQKPIYKEDGDYVKLIFEFAPDLNASDSDEDKIRKYIEMHKEVTVKEIINLLSVSRNTATRKLNNMIDKNLLVRKGKGPAVKYFLK